MSDNLNVLDKYKRTSLIIACSNADTALIKFLLDKKVNPLIQDEDGKTALHHLALARGHRSTCSQSDKSLELITQQLVNYIADYTRSNQLDYTCSNQPDYKKKFDLCDEIIDEM